MPHLDPSRESAAPPPHSDVLPLRDARARGGRVPTCLRGAATIGLALASAEARAQSADAPSDTAPRHDSTAVRLAPVGFRPGLTEGSGITPRGHLVVEVGASLEGGAGGDPRSLRAGEVVLHVPVGARAELRLGVPSYSRRTAGGLPARAGVGPGGAALAIRVTEGAGRPGWSTPIVAVVLGTGIPVGSMSGPDRAWQPSGKLVIEVPASPTVTVLANTGVRRAGTAGARRAEPFASGWVHRRVGARTGAYGETMLTFRPAGAGGDQVTAHAGLTHRVTTNHHLDLHVGRVLHGGRMPLAGVGLTTRF